MSMQDIVEKLKLDDLKNHYASSGIIIPPDFTAFLVEDLLVFGERLRRLQASPKPVTTRGLSRAMRDLVRGAVVCGHPDNGWYVTQSTRVTRIWACRFYAPKAKTADTKLWMSVRDCLARSEAAFANSPNAVSVQYDDLFSRLPKRPSALNGMGRYCTIETMPLNVRFYEKPTRNCSCWVTRDIVRNLLLLSHGDRVRVCPGNTLFLGAKDRLVVIEAWTPQSEKRR